MSAGRIAHVIARAKERYGLALSQTDVETIEKRILDCDSGKSATGVKFIGLMDDGDSRYQVSFGDKVLRLMVDSRTGLIKTLLPALGECGGSFKLSQHLGTDRPRARDGQDRK